MSQDFNRGYEDYFKALEQQLNKKNNPLPAKTAVPEHNASVKPKKKKGVYKVIRLRKSVVAVFLCVLLTVCGSLVITGLKKPDTEADTPKSDVEKTESGVKEEKKQKIVYEFTEETVDLPIANDAKNAIIVRKSDNTVVASREAHTRAYPASTTKIMTLLVAAENIDDLNDTFTMTLAVTDPLYVAKASVAGFLNNEVVTMTDMLYGTILPSGADAAMGLAIKIAGGEDGFVELMNKKVKELGLKNTHFDNVTGLHSEQNYSTAYDMAVILDAALQNELCKKVLSTYQHTTAVTAQHPEGILLSSTLFNYMYGTEPVTATILGGKTGFVNESGYCIASYGAANETGTEYIVVTLGNSARWPAFYGQIDLYKEFAK